MRMGFLEKNFSLATLYFSFLIGSSGSKREIKFVWLQYRRVNDLILRPPPFAGMAGGGIVAFYENKALDSQGRSLGEILQWPAADLEYCHDYIQVLFPLPERSAFNDPAPVIDQEVFEAFQSREDLRDRLRDSFKKILWFYGYELHKNTDDSLEVRPGPTFGRHSGNWKTTFNHNHLRMTRIIRSLRVLGLEEEAVAFYEAISQARTISPKSRTYWKRAASRPLNIAPHVSDAEIDMDRCSGPEFLWKFEKEKGFEAV